MQSRALKHLCHCQFLAALGNKLELDLNSAQDFFSGGHSTEQLFKATQMP